MTEPLAGVPARRRRARLPACRGRRRRLVVDRAGALLGALALVRAEYLRGRPLLLPLLSLARRWRRSGLRAAVGRPGGDARWRRWSSWRRGRSATRSRSIASCRSRPAAARCSTSGPTSTPTARARSYATGCSLATRVCAAQIEREGPPEDPDSYALERLLARVASDEYPGPGHRRRAGAARPREPARRRHRSSAALRRPAGEQGLRHLDRAGPGGDGRPPWRLLQLGLLVAALSGWRCWRCAAPLRGAASSA